MDAAQKYKRTIYSCCLSNAAGAFLAATPPILFTALKDLYGFSFEQLGRLVMMNFLIQVASALFFSRLVDRYGARRFMIMGQLFAFSGFFLYGLTPFLLPDYEYAGLSVAVAIMAVGGGLYELLLSPIVNAVPLPEKEKAGAMTALHSFYAWGSVAAVLLTTLLLSMWGQTNWFKIVLLWSLAPLAALLVFVTVPIAPPVPEEKRTKVRELLGNKSFLLIVLCLIMGGAAEVSMSQWASSFMDAALRLPKVLGDVAGVCMFSVMLGLGRSLYGRFSKSLPIEKAMLAGGILAAVCYITAAISPLPLLSLVMCALCGLMVSLLWPGSLVLAAARFPMAGATMFALLSAGGVLGCAVGPWLVGLAADTAPKVAGALLPALSPESLGLRAGLLLAALFPLGFVLSMRAIQKRRAQRDERESSPKAQ